MIPELTVNRIETNMPQIQSQEIPVNPIRIPEPSYTEDFIKKYQGTPAYWLQRILRIFKVLSILLFVSSIGSYAWSNQGLWFSVLCGILAITLNRWWVYLLVSFLTGTYLILVGFYLKLVYDHFIDNPMYWASLLLLTLIGIIGYVGYHTLQEWRDFLGRW